MLAGLQREMHEYGRESQLWGKQPPLSKARLEELFALLVTMVLLAKSAVFAMPSISRAAPLRAL